MAGMAIPGQTPDPSKVSRYRADAGRSMTDAEYAQWRELAARRARQEAAEFARTAGGAAQVSPTGDIVYQTGGYPSSRFGGANGGGYQTSAPSAVSVSGGLTDRERMELEARYAAETQQRQQQFEREQQTSSQQATLARQQFEREQQTATQQAALAQQAESARLQREAEERRLALLSPSLQPPQVQYGAGTGGDTEAARAATFARAKDRAAQIARASLTGLQSAMAGRGISGSGIEAAGMGDIVGQAGGALGEINREQLIQDLARTGDVASTTYQGAIQQRAQDLANRQSLMGLITARGLY